MYIHLSISTALRQRTCILLIVFGIMISTLSLLYSILRIPFLQSAGISPPIMTVRNPLFIFLIFHRRSRSSSQIYHVFIDNPTLSTDYMNELLAIAETQENRITKELMTFVTRILLIAELDRAQKERVIISQRTKDGMTARQAEAAARGEHWRAGRKPGQLDKMTPELEADLREYLADRSIKGVALMKKHHISRTTLLKYAEIIKTQKVK